MSDRGYHQAGCPIAAALEVIGDRWTILIVRELMAGPRRFSELLAALPGLAPNLLSNRLKALATAGVAKREYFKELPPRTEYSLTDTGEDLRPILLELLRWGNAHVAPARDEATVLQRWLTSLPLLSQPLGLDGGARIHFAIDGHDSTGWLVECQGARVGVSSTTTPPADAVRVSTDRPTLTAILQRQMSLESATSAGSARIEGDFTLAQRFLSVLPPL